MLTLALYFLCIPLAVFVFIAGCFLWYILLAAAWGLLCEAAAWVKRGGE